MHRFLPKSQDVRRLLRHSAELELSDDAITRLKWFLYCSDHYYNVSLTCRHFGISRSTFLRWAQRFDASDTGTLEEHSRRPHSVRQSGMDERVIGFIEQIRREFPEMGKVPVSELLMKRHGVVLSSSTVGRIIARHGLYFGLSTSHVAKRARALEKFAENVEAEQPTPKPTRVKPATDVEDDTGMLPLPTLAS